MIIGITGGTGCGKTTFLECFARIGGEILDCDAIYHTLLQTDPELLRAIENRFPGTVEDGALKRKELGSIVFADPDSLLALNEITHNAVKEEVIRRLHQGAQLAAIDAIALFEGGLAELCDVTVAITAPLEDRITRLMNRDGIGEEYARARITAQKPESWFREKCDYILENDGSKDAFSERCIAFLQQLGIMKLSDISQEKR